MGRSRFPGKPLKFHNRKRISLILGVVYNETPLESNTTGDVPSNANEEKKEEEEKKQVDTECSDKGEVNALEDIEINKENPTETDLQSSVRTRSQNKMDTKVDKPKPIKKTVRFGTVESCEDLMFPLKKLPSKHQAPLASIIKKKSALKQSEYSTFGGILKPAKLTDLSSKSSLEYQEGFLSKNLNPLSKSLNKFSQFAESRCLSPPPKSCSIGDSDSGNKFVLPSRSSHSSRVIKPNKKFMDIDEPITNTTSTNSSKVLKKPKLKRLVFNVLQDGDSPDDSEEKTTEQENSSSSNIFKEKIPFSGPKSGLSKLSRELFTKEQDSPHEENVESFDKLKQESQKEVHGGHSLRKLVDISDPSSNSSSESGSESWDSDSADGTDGKSGSLSPEREKAPASQLLSGKVIIREARLQLNTPAQVSVGPDGPFSSFTGCSSSNQATTVTCGVCGAVRFYKFVKQARKFGIYSCESCRKFISKMIQKENVSHTNGPIIIQCLKREGNCHVPPIVRSQQWKFKRCANKARCPACWLKMCLKAFQVPPSIKAGLTAMLPVNMRSALSPVTSQASPLRLNSNTLTGQPVFGMSNTNDSEKCKVKKVDEVPDKLEDIQNENQVDDITDENESRKRSIARVKVKKKDCTEDDSKRQKVELKGPRVKHVCRSASIVLGQPIATFPAQDEKVEEKCTSPVAVCDVNDKPIVDVKEEDKKRKVEVSKPQVKVESSEDETILDLMPKRIACKPLSNITNTRSRPQKCSQNRSELICVDFWESYDPDEVCSTGFGIIGTTPFTVQRLCFLCGSAGQEKMVSCVRCCEWFHLWCAEGVVKSGWACGRCVGCGCCGASGATHECRLCLQRFHLTCLQPKPKDSRADWPQICSACLKCKSCDSERVTKFVGSLPFCSSCFKLRQKGNYCPLCQACYRDNDFDSKMMECGWCSRWVHASCEELSGEGYQLLSALPPSIEYICRQCMPHDPPWRKMLTEHLKGRLLHLLKLLAKNKKACSLLKLTPHKNTPVPSNRHFRVTSPTAIRKLHFDDKTTETKVYRNMSKGRRTQIKTDEMSPSNLWSHNSMLQSVQINEEDLPHSSQKVVNLQEPLMQNKEICFSAFETPSIEAHASEKISNANVETDLEPVNKFEPISDDDDSVKSDNESNMSINQIPSTPTDNADSESSRFNSPSLLDIKRRVNSDEYMSLKDFNHDMKDVIERTTNDDLLLIYENLFSETFPWFDCKSNCLQPNLEVDGENDDTDSLKDQELIENKLPIANKAYMNRLCDQIVPKFDIDGPNPDDILEFYPTVDTRTCILCKSVGDGIPVMEGRLLYCGQNDWIHANCALWSAEVFEEIDGSLQNVHSAISRGKMIKCALCELKGASVGCCAKNCGETFHYACARNGDCTFLDDKRVFCSAHGKDIPKKSLQKDNDFALTRPVYVELDRKKKRYSEIDKVQFLLGSLTVLNLGKIVPTVSDFEEYLMPVDFKCSRLFWSCKKAPKIVKYTIRTKLILSEPLPGIDYGVNITVDHSMPTHVVERVISEIGAWHSSIESNKKSKPFLIKNDNSPIKFGGVTLQDIAVKQVVEFLLDNVCKQEQDEEERQNTADLLPPEIEDAILEDLNHDLLDGISMQDIFPKLMTYEDFVAMDLKNEFYGAIAQGEDKNGDSKSTTDFIDELLNARLESGSKELKRSKSEMILQNHNLKNLTTGRGQQRSSSLTWSNKFDTNLLSSTIKRCKMGLTSSAAGKMSPIQKNTENQLNAIKESESHKKPKEITPSTSVNSETAHTSSMTFRNSPPKEKSDTSLDKSDKAEGYYTDVIDFYTKIQCSPISQLDGTADWSDSESHVSSRSNSPDHEKCFSPIQQLDGADDMSNINDIHRNQPNQSNQFLYRANGTESYTVTIAGNAISGQPELVMRPIDESIVKGEQPVRCDRCQCTYRNKESYDRHIPSCDMMSTSESESENPKSPENRTLTTLQNAFQGAFAQPMIIHAGVVSGTENTIKAESISARRTSINTRQITINGTIVETPTSGQTNEMTMTITEQMKTGTVIFDQSNTNNMQVSGNQQVLSSPQIVVTPQMLIPSKSGQGQKIVGQQILGQPGMIPYNICVKPGTNNHNIQQIQSGADMAQLLAGAGGIQVIPPNSGQMLTIPTNQSNNIGNIGSIIQGKTQLTNFPNIASAPSIALPVNSLQNPGSIQSMIRPNMQNNSTVVMPALATQRHTSPNIQNKQQILIQSSGHKSPKKQPMAVQPKPIFQNVSRGRGRPVPKPTTIKRHTKVEKTYTTINQPLGNGNTVIQLQTNNQAGQPSIIVQPVGNQNLMSAYVEALSQQQNQNMQYIATIAPQNEFKAGPTQFISQGGLMPQTYQIQQTENGGLVAVPSGGIPLLLPQGNVGLIPQTLQQGTTILPQGTLQQGIISQGANGPTLLPQAIHTQNGTTIIPQSAIQGLTAGNITSQGTILSNNSLQGATIVSQSNMGNGQASILSNAQGNTLLSSTPGAILPQGTLLPQFCNDQVLIGSTPTLEMVTDPNGCMYLTTTQPVYYGLETIVQNTVMSSQQFVSTAMQGVLAQNSSFSATTTQVFQASKIEPIVEVPTGYVVVNNVGENVSNQACSSANVVSGQTIHSSPQTMKNVKTSVPNLTVQPLTDKGNNINRQTSKIIQMNSTPIAVVSSGTIIGTKANVNPLSSQIQTMTLSSAAQIVSRPTVTKQSNINISVPNVTLVSSSGQPLISISQSMPHSAQSFPISLSQQPIVSSTVVPSTSKNPHVLEISGNLQNNGNSITPTINITSNLKSPTPWKQISSASNMDINKVTDATGKNMNGNIITCSTVNGRNTLQINEIDKNCQNFLVPASVGPNPTSTANFLQHFETMNVSHHSSVHNTQNNVIQISSGNIYPPSSVMSTNIDAETSLKLSKINALSKTEGGHLNFSQEIMASHSQQHAQNEKTFQNIGSSDNKHLESHQNQMNIQKLSSCQMVNNISGMNVMQHNNIRQQSHMNTSNSNQNCPPQASPSHTMQIQNSENNISYQGVTQNRMQSTNENNQQQPSCQMEMPNLPSAPNSNIQMVPHESHHQIHIMNGQIQNNRPNDSCNQNNNSVNHSICGRPFSDNTNSMHNTTVHRTTPENSIMVNQNMKLHNMGNRNQNEINLGHLQQSMQSNINMQNSRLAMDNFQGHSINNMGQHQVHNRPLDNSQNTPQIHHSLPNRQQIDTHVNQQMNSQPNKQMEVSHHHQHQMVGQMMQNNRPHIDNNMLGFHQNISNSMQNRQIESHMHLMQTNNQSMNMGGIHLDNNVSIPTNLHNRHDNSMIQPLMQTNRNNIEHSPHMSQLGINTMNNMAMHSQINHQPMMHNVPDMKNEMQNNCAGSCSNSHSQFMNNQVYDMCNSNLNPNTNMTASGNMMHNVNMNTSNNAILNRPHENNMYANNSQSGVSTHDMLMSCNNNSEHCMKNLMPGNHNNIMMNNPNQLMTNQMPLNNPMNMNSCSLNHTNPGQSSDRVNNIGVAEQMKFSSETCRGKNIGVSNTGQVSNDCVKSNLNIVHNEKTPHNIMPNQMGFMPMNTQNRIINLPERNRTNNTNMDNNVNIPQQHNIRVVTNNATNVAGISGETMSYHQKAENSTMINVPFQAIPNSAPMNINVNSSNNTVNITVQNNLVDPKIASKAGNDLSFPLSNTNIIPNANNNSNMICIPVPNNTINLSTQNSMSINLPKAPPTQQTGIPTNVVNPMSMRPMNRVLPLHRDGQSKRVKSPTISQPAPTQRLPNNDMPDLNLKIDNVDSDINKAIEESKRIMELERKKNENESRNSVQRPQLVVNHGQSLNTASQAISEASQIRKASKMASLPRLVDDMEVDPPKPEKRVRYTVPKMLTTSKIVKRSLTDKNSEEAVVVKKQSKISKGQENVLKGSTIKKNSDPPKEDGPKLVYEVTSEDGFSYSSSSLTDLWAKVVEAVQNARKNAGLPPIPYNFSTNTSGAHLIGLNNNGLRYLVEQLPGASRCSKYKIRHGRQLSLLDNDLDLSEGFKESQWGSARLGPVVRKHAHDMFAWMASPYREEPPPFSGTDGESIMSRRLATLPLAMRFRHLKETSKASVGVYRSHIHGRGLFCKKDIEEGDMVIEYAGEVIRAVLADQREKRYEAMRGRRGVFGCYMFRIDDNLVVDATLKGNAARFINHSCDPNCYSRVVDIHGHKHILIFALRRISIGEELTYDYKFPFEEIKIPCTCGAKKCRKYLN